MKEITFKAENEFELFFIVEDYMNGFVQRNGKIDKKKWEAQVSKEKFLQLYPLGSSVICKTDYYKQYLLNNEYQIEDVKVYIDSYNTEEISVLIRGEDNVATWKKLNSFPKNFQIMSKD